MDKVGMRNCLYTGNTIIKNYAVLFQDLEKLKKGEKALKDLMIFKNEEFGEVRTVTKENKPYLCLADVCKILDLEQVSRVKSRLSQDGVIISKVIDSLGREQQATFINESNLYKVIFQSRKTEAEKFTEWVTSEVLPSIRKTGGYIAGEENMTEDELVLKAMNVLNTKVENLKQKNEQLQSENEKQNQLIGELKPKADYTDRILQSKGTTKVNVIANDYGYTAIDFNKLLHRLGIQYKQGEDWLLYREYRGKGYTHSKTFSFKRKNGATGSKTNMEWTQKGRLFLYEKLKKHDIVPTIEDI